MQGQLQHQQIVMFCLQICNLCIIHQCKDSLVINFYFVRQ